MGGPKGRVTSEVGSICRREKIAPGRTLEAPDPGRTRDRISAWLAFLLAALPSVRSSNAIDE